MGFAQITRLIASTVQTVLKGFDVAGGGVVHDGKGETESQASSRFKFSEHHVESGIAGKTDHR